jgi:hypothetical protein
MTTDDINRLRFLMSGNYYSSYFHAQNIALAAQNTYADSIRTAGREIRTPGLVRGSAAECSRGYSILTSSTGMENLFATWDQIFIKITS